MPTHMQSSQQHANTLAVQSAADYLMLLHSLKPGKVKDNWRQLEATESPANVAEPDKTQNTDVFSLLSTPKIQPV